MRTISSPSTIAICWHNVLCHLPSVTQLAQCFVPSDWHNVRAVKILLDIQSNVAAPVNTTVGLLPLRDTNLFNIPSPCLGRCPYQSAQAMDLYLPVAR
eukprot:6195461-Pleurochrysis_carterae.AAC.2